MKKKELSEEREKACADDPKSKGCKTAKLQLTKILEKIKIKSLEDREKDERREWYWKSKLLKKEKKE